MAGTVWTQNFSGVKLQMTASGEALIAKLMPHLISALSSNATLRNAIVSAIMPAVRQQAATTAAQTAGGKKP
jgi:hypothetical protein